MEKVSRRDGVDKGSKGMRFVRRYRSGKNCVYGDVAVSANAVRKRRYIQPRGQQLCLPSRESCRTRHQLPYKIVRAIDSASLILRMSHPLIMPSIVAVLVSCTTENTELHSDGGIRFIETSKEISLVTRAMKEGRIILLLYTGCVFE